MRDDPFLLSWESFLPPNAVVMVRTSAAMPRFLFEVPGLETPAHRELFDKIILALSLDPSDYVVAGSKTPVQSQIRFVASEGEGGSLGVWETHEDAFNQPLPTLTTYSLLAMVENPGLKREVWNHLKEAINLTTSNA